MSAFEYLIAFVSVVAGLALTRGLSGLAKIVHLRKEIQLSGVHAAWTATMILWLISYWWFTFWLVAIDNWTVPLFLFVLVYGAVIYFLLSLLYPDKLEPGMDLFEYFLDNRRWFFGTFIGLGLLDLADTWLKSLYDLPPTPMIPYSILMISWLSLGIVGAITGNRTFHTVYAYLWLVVFGLWATVVLLTISDSIASVR